MVAMETQTRPPEMQSKMRPFSVLSHASTVSPGKYLYCFSIIMLHIRLKYITPRLIRLKIKEIPLFRSVLWGALSGKGKFAGS